MIQHLIDENVAITSTLAIIISGADEPSAIRVIADTVGFQASTSVCTTPS